MSCKDLDRRFHYPYNTPGRCRKCNGKLARYPQTGILPPRDACMACSWTKWDMPGMEKPDFDVMPTR